jgi:hypothetical protein
VWRGETFGGFVGGEAIAGRGCNGIQDGICEVRGRRIERREGAARCVPAQIDRRSSLDVYIDKIVAYWLHSTHT